jgi:mono/diheme cytochrome c family protein
VYSKKSLERGSASVRATVASACNECHFAGTQWREGIENALKISGFLLWATGLPPSSDIAIMPAFGSAWSDEDIAAVSNYVVARFGARASAITGAEVQRLRDAK